MCCRDVLKKVDRETLDGGFILLLELVLEGEDVVTDDECRADEFERGL